jgi:hypothetical protein
MIKEWGCKMNKSQISIKIRRSTHEAAMDQLRAARQVYGEQLSVAGWLDKLIAAGLADFKKTDCRKKTIA